jgi:hypothetical protein
VATKVPTRNAKLPYSSGPSSRAIIKVVIKANAPRKRLARTLTVKRDVTDELVKDILILVKLKRLPFTP